MIALEQRQVQFEKIIMERFSNHCPRCDCSTSVTSFANSATTATGETGFPMSSFHALDEFIVKLDDKKFERDAVIINLSSYLHLIHSWPIYVIFLFRLLV